MTILVTGRGGSLAADLVPVLERRDHHVIATSRADLDLAKPDSILEIVRDVRPEIIINTAAKTDVEGCESHEAEAVLINGDAVGALAEAAAAVGAHLVTMSTDYVFDGRKPTAYVEDDPTNPQSAYGRSKVVGEKLALPDATVVRTAWLAGRTGPSIVRTVLRLLDGDGTLRFVDDQRGSPTFTADLAVALADLATERKSGVFHLTNAGAVTWFEFVQEIARQTGAEVGRVEPIASADLVPAQLAPRPANSVLNNAAWREMGGTPLRPYESALAELLADFR